MAFLGHVVKEIGVLVNSQRSESVVVWKRPQSVSKMIQFEALYARSGRSLICRERNTDKILLGPELVGRTVQMLFD